MKTRTTAPAVSAKKTLSIKSGVRAGITAGIRGSNLTYPNCPQTFNCG